MKAVGVVAEFNPFHRGHAYLLETAKSRFPDHAVVCAMSGNFVQRGEMAVQEKYSRARCALSHGADLVLEIPFPFSSLSAESFALAAVHILTSLPAINTLLFGTENADVKRLQRCAENLSSPAFQTAFGNARLQEKGTGYPALREKVYESLFGKCEELSLPNFSLAAAYLVALRREGKELDLLPVLRLPDSESIASATVLRQKLLRGERESVFPFLPDRTIAEIAREEDAGRFPVSMETYFFTLKYLLQTLDRRTLASFYGMAPLVFRAKSAAQKAKTLSELVEMTVSPSFTASRVRRAILSLLCRTERGAEKETPAYTLVLGATKRGREVLNNARDCAAIPIFTKPAHALRHDSALVRRQASAHFLADQIYAMAFPVPADDGYYLKQYPSV